MDAGTNKTMGPGKYPIGYWAREADKLLTEAINQIHSSFGINRTQWQLLHLLHENGKLSMDHISGIMQPFEGKQNIRETLDSLGIRNIIQEERDGYLLTGEGEALHSACFQKQKEFRAKCMQNISPKDYDITINTLQQLVANLSGE